MWPYKLIFVREPLNLDLHNIHEKKCEYFNGIITGNKTKDRQFTMIKRTKTNNGLTKHYAKTKY